MITRSGSCTISNGSGREPDPRHPGDQATRHRIVDASAREIVLALLLGVRLVWRRLGGGGDGRALRRIRARGRDVSSPSKSGSALRGIQTPERSGFPLSARRGLFRGARFALRAGCAPGRASSGARAAIASAPLDAFHGVPSSLRPSPTARPCRRAGPLRACDRPRTSPCERRRGWARRARANPCTVTVVADLHRHVLLPALPHEHVRRIAFEPPLRELPSSPLTSTRSARADWPTRSRDAARHRDRLLPSYPAANE